MENEEIIFFLWIARTEAALDAKKIWSVLDTCIIGDGTVQLQKDVVMSVATARTILIQGSGDKPLRKCLTEQMNPWKMWIRLYELYALYT